MEWIYASKERLDSQRTGRRRLKKCSPNLLFLLLLLLLLQSDFLCLGKRRSASVQLPVGYFQGIQNRTLRLPPAWLAWQSKGFQSEDFRIVAAVNGKTVSAQGFNMSFRTPGIYQVDVTISSIHSNASRTDRQVFSIVEDSRLDSEWPPTNGWMPRLSTVDSCVYFAQSSTRVIHPKQYPMARPIPMAFNISVLLDPHLHFQQKHQNPKVDYQERVVVAKNAMIQVEAFEVSKKDQSRIRKSLMLRHNLKDAPVDRFFIERGIGAGTIQILRPGIALDIELELHFSLCCMESCRHVYSSSIQILSPHQMVYQELPALLKGDFKFETGAKLLARHNLRIPVGSSVTFKEGTMLFLSPGVNVTVDGTLAFLGGSEEGNLPIMVLPFLDSTHWGGFESVNFPQAQIDASNTIFYGGGSESSTNVEHRNDQGVFLMKHSSLNLLHSMVLIARGQGIIAKQANIRVTSSLFQGLSAGMKLYDTHTEILHSSFSDFPRRHGSYRNEDNDGFYIVGGSTLFQGCWLRHAKDDCIDSGTGEGGFLRIVATWIESCGHEGIALSNQGVKEKRVEIQQVHVLNCQQGIELGFSTNRFHATVEASVLQQNLVGLRYGDNYAFHQNGYLWGGQLLLANNTRPVLNLHRSTYLPVEDRLYLSDIQVHSEAVDLGTTGVLFIPNVLRHHTLLLQEKDLLFRSFSTEKREEAKIHQPTCSSSSTSNSSSSYSSSSSNNSNSNSWSSKIGSRTDVVSTE